MFMIPSPQKPPGVPPVHCDALNIQELSQVNVPPVKLSMFVQFNPLRLPSSHCSPAVMKLSPQVEVSEHCERFKIQLGVQDKNPPVKLSKSVHKFVILLPFQSHCSPVFITPSPQEPGDKPVH